MFSREEYPYEWVETGIHYTVYDAACEVLKKCEMKPEEAVATFFQYLADNKDTLMSLAEGKVPKIPVLRDEELVDRVERYTVLSVGYLLCHKRTEAMAKRE